MENTEIESTQILKFLNENKDCLRMRGIELKANIKKRTISDLMTGVIKQLSSVTINKLTPVLIKYGYDVNNYYGYEKVIVDAVASVYKYPISKKQLLGNPKKREIVIARQICMVYRVFILKMSQQQAADRYKKDHSTVPHSIKTFNNLRDSDKRYKEMISNIEKRLNCEF